MHGGILEENPTRVLGFSKLDIRNGIKIRFWDDIWWAISLLNRLSHIYSTLLGRRMRQWWTTYSYQMVILNGM